MTARAQHQRMSPFAVSALAALGIGFIDGLLTRPGSWSAALIKPQWQPPAWVFGAVWTIVICFVALAAAVAWKELANGEDRKWLLCLLSINAAFNIVWSPLFYMLRRPDLAAVDIALLWISIGACIVFLVPRAPNAALLFAPYLVWITIAAALNVEIVRLNAPF